jgi:Tol biopolymer transport system component
VSFATTGPRILRKLANGAGEAEVLHQVVARGTFLTDWSRDGRHILLSLSQTAPLSPDLVIMNLDGERKLVPFLATPFAEVGGRFSPDGRWIAYMSNDSGVMQVFVQQFEPGKPASGARWQVSTSGGNAPVWRGDGKELFYFAPDGKLMAVRCRTDGEVFQSDTPALLFETAAVAAGGFDVTRDGQRFVLSEPSEQERSQPMTVIVNWQAGLKK